MAAKLASKKLIAYGDAAKAQEVAREKWAERARRIDTASAMETSIAAQRAALNAGANYDDVVSASVFAKPKPGMLKQQRDAAEAQSTVTRQKASEAAATGDHKTAALLHKDAAEKHRAAMKTAISAGNAEAAGHHAAQHKMHTQDAESHTRALGQRVKTLRALQRGKKGGVYYVSESGRKVYR